MSSYIQITNLTPRSSELLGIISQTLTTFNNLTQLKRTMDSIIGTEMDFTKLGNVYGISPADAEIIFNLLVQVQLAIVNYAALTDFTTNIGQ